MGSKDFYLEIGKVGDIVDKKFLSRFSLMISAKVCRMYIMYVFFFFLSRRCVRYVKASCHAIVLCSALSHE